MQDRSKLTVKDRNESLAEFLGWYKEPDQPETYFEVSGNAIRVAYSLYGDQFKELPFHRDVNYLLKVLDQLKATVLPSNQSNKAKVNQFVWDRFEIGLNQFCCFLYQWQGKKKKGWRMFDDKNEELSIFYIIGVNCKDWMEGLYLFLSDIVLTIQGK